MNAPNKQPRHLKARLQRPAHGSAADAEEHEHPPKRYEGRLALRAGARRHPPRGDPERIPARPARPSSGCGGTVGQAATEAALRERETNDYLLGHDYFMRTVLYSDFHPHFSFAFGVLSVERLISLEFA